MSLQMSESNNRGGCPETYTLTAVGTWDDTSFEFEAVEQWNPTNAGDLDCVLAYPCDRSYVLTALRSAEVFPQQCD